MRKYALCAIILVASLSLKAQTSSVNSTPKFRIALNGGYSYRLAKIADNLTAAEKSYVKGLKSGYNLGVDAGYFFSSWGIGISYNLSRATNSIDNFQIPDANGTIIKGKMQDDISIHFVGPNFGIRHISANNKHIVLVNMALGYLGYVDNAVAINPVKITGGTFGSGFDLAYDYKISNGIYIGAKLGTVAGKLKKLNYQNVQTGAGNTVELKKEEYENLSRLDISAGIKFNL